MQPITESIKAIETSLRNEEEKLERLKSGQTQEELVKKLQTELRELEQELVSLKKQKDQIQVSQAKEKAEFESLHNRMEEL
jgi:predicted DNA-binding protein YlxM (UPF0122 family)